MVYRPVREKTPEVLCRQAKCAYESTGYDEISLSSLSISDYSELDSLTDGLLSWTEDEKVKLSLPSLRVDSFTRELMEKMGPEDILMVTADHGCDPGYSGTDHTRENVPVLMFGKNVVSEDLGIRQTYTDILVLSISIYVSSKSS